MRPTGIVLIASGNETHRRQLAVTRQQLRESFPGWDHFLLADRSLSSQGVGVTFRAPIMTRHHEVEVLGKAAVAQVSLESPVDADGLLTRINQLSPWKYSLYLAAGTNVAGLTAIDWQTLDLFPAAVALHPDQTVERAVAVAREKRKLPTQLADETLDLCGTASPFFSTRVLFWRRYLQADLLFAAWHEEWKRYRHETDLAFARALARTGTPIAVLRHALSLPETSDEYRDDFSAQRSESLATSSNNRLTKKKTRRA